eukprot:239062_1
MNTRTLSTILTFNFVASTFNVHVEPLIKSQSKYRPSMDKSVTETLMAMINSIFHTTNISLQNQFKKYKLAYKSMLLIFFLLIFLFVIVFIIFENNRTSNDDKYKEIQFDDESYISVTYIALAICLCISLFLTWTYNRIYRSLREQWRNECVRNLCQAASIWAMQFPIIQYEVKYPGFMYKDLLKASVKKAKKAFKDTTKKQKKSKKKSILRSPMRMNSPHNGFSSPFASPAKYDKLAEETEEEGLNICKLALCCCTIKDSWGFIRVFYKFDKNNNNDALQFALNELQKLHCLIDEDEPIKNNVQIVQMVPQNQFKQNLNLQLPLPQQHPSENVQESELELNSDLMEGSEIQ